MAGMKGIMLCGDCAYYDFKKHKCKLGCNDDSDARSSFYCDCKLPDVVPRSEVEQAKQEVAREIFEEIEYLIWQYDTRPASELTEEIAKLKKKYTEDKE